MATYYVRVHAFNTTVTVKPGGGSIRTISSGNSARIAVSDSHPYIIFTHSSASAIITMGNYKRFRVYPSAAQSISGSTSLYYYLEDIDSNHSLYTPAEIAVTASNSCIIWAAVGDYCSSYTLNTQLSTYTINHWNFYPYIASTTYNASLYNVSASYNQFCMRYNSSGQYYAGTAGEIKSTSGGSDSIGTINQQYRWISVDGYTNSPTGSYSCKINILTSGGKHPKAGQTEQGYTYSSQVMDGISSILVGKGTSLSDPHVITAGNSYTYTGLVKNDEIYIGSIKFAPGYSYPVYGYPDRTYGENWDYAPTAEGITVQDPIVIAGENHVWQPNGNRDVYIFATDIGKTNYVVYGNSGEVAYSAEITSGNSVTIGAPSTYGIIVPDSSYSFEGYTQIYGSTIKQFSVGDVVNPRTYAVDNTFGIYPIWSKTVTVTSGHPATPSTTTGYLSGGIYTATLPTPNAVSGWTPIGWRDDTSAADKEADSNAPTPIDSSTWYGVYSRSVGINFNKGNISEISGTPPTVNPQTQYFNSGGGTSSVSFTLPDSTFTHPSYYEFAGWSTNPNATTGIKKGEIFTANPGVGDAVPLTLYAIWKRLFNTLTYYDGQGNSTSVTVNVGYNHSMLGSTTFSKSGYKLIGWNTSSTGSDPHHYQFGEVITPTSDMVFYAVWYELFNWTDNDAVKVVAGQPTTNATAAKWNELESKIKGYINSSYTVTPELSNNPMIATRFNRAVTGLGLTLTTVSAGEIILAADFIAVKDKLNADAKYL